MAEHADGSIIVDTEIDSSGFKAGSTELKSAIKSLTNKVQGLGPTFQKAMAGNTKAMGTFEAKASALKSKISELESKQARLGHARLPTEDYKFFTLELEKARKQLAQLEAREAKMKATGVSQKSQAYKSLQYDIALTKEKILDLEATMAGMRQNGTAFQMGSATPEYQQMASALKVAKQQLAEMDAATSSVKVNASTLPPIGQRVASAFARAGSIIKSSVVSGLSIAARAAKNLLTHTLKAVAGMNKLGKSSQRTGRGFGGMLKSMLFFSAFSAVLKSLKEGIDALALSSSSFNNTMSQLKTSAASLRNSLITAFAPILSVVVPILSILISKLATAINLIGQFFAALTGAKSYTKAITQQQDYAASLGETAGAAKEAKRQLAGFDELNVLSDSSGGGGGGGAGDGAGATFEEVPIDGGISDFVNRIKEAFANGEYAEIGRIIGEKINEVFQTIHDYIAWDRVGEPIKKYIGIFCEIFNSLVDTIDWNLIGDTFAEGVNTITNTLYYLLTGIDWENLGRGFGEGLNGLVHGVDWERLGQTIGAYFMARLNVIYGAVTTFDWKGTGAALGTALMGLWNSIDWAKAGKTLSTALIGVLNTISETIKTIDWQKVGNDIAVFIAAIDWNGIIVALSDGLGAALGGLTALLVGLLEDAWGAVVDWWYDVAYEDGAFTIEGLLQGIWDAICDIGKWIVDNIFKPFINGFCEAFGINSPSTVMAEQGGFIIAGLLEGITAAWDSITKFFGEALASLTETLSDGWETIKKGAGTAWNKVSTTVSDAWDGLKKGVTKGAEKVGETVSTGWNNIKKWTSERWDNVKSSVSNAWESIKSNTSKDGTSIGTTVSNAWSKVKSHVSTKMNEAKSSASSAWSSIKSTATSTGSTISSNVSSAWSKAKNYISSNLTSAKSTAASVWSSIKSTTSSQNNSIKSTLSSTWSSIKSTLSSGMSKIKSSMSSTFSSLKSSASTWGSHICENIASGIRNAIYKVKNAATNVANAIRRILGFSEPEEGPLSNFHTYMPDMLDLMEKGILDNEYKAANAAAHVAKAISNEVQNGDYGTGNIVPEGQIESTLTGFSDKIAESFTELMSRLQSIADSVTFAAPEVVRGVAPYGIAAAVNSSKSNASGCDESSNDDISSVVIQSVNNATVAIVKAIQEYSKTNVNIDSESLTDTIINEINRRTKMNGKSPLLT